MEEAGLEFRATKDEADRSIDPKSLKINSSVGEIAERIARAYGLSRLREA